MYFEDVEKSSQKGHIIPSTLSEVASHYSLMLKLFDREILNSIVTSVFSQAIAKYQKVAFWN